MVSGQSLYVLLHNTRNNIKELKCPTNIYMAIFRYRCLFNTEHIQQLEVTGCLLKKYKSTGM